jgi:hypothetical protein
MGSEYCEVLDLFNGSVWQTFLLDAEETQTEGIDLKQSIRSYSILRAPGDGDRVPSHSLTLISHEQSVPTAVIKKQVYVKGPGLYPTHFYLRLHHRFIYTFQDFQHTPFIINT